MEESQIIDIIIYVLAACLTVSIFRYWKKNDTPVAVIKRTMMWIVLIFATLVVLAIGLTSNMSEIPISDTQNILAVVHKALQLPYFSFCYFMLFIGIIYLIRDRRRKLVAKKNTKKKK
jgi:hypothetical protein